MRLVWVARPHPLVQSSRTPLPPLLSSPLWRAHTCVGVCVCACARANAWLCVLVRARARARAWAGPYPGQRRGVGGGNTGHDRVPRHTGARLCAGVRAPVSACARLRAHGACARLCACVRAPVCARLCVCVRACMRSRTSSATPKRVRVRARLCGRVCERGRAGSATARARIRRNR